MKPSRFDYVRPETLAEALAKLTEYGAEAAVLAGGQSLMPMLNLRVAQPSLLIDINALPDLERIERTGQRLVIGARARHNDVLRSPLVQESAPLLGRALRHVAHEAIRNRGTFGGSLALADPSAELPACVVCLGAEIVAASSRGERNIPAESFFEGLYATALEPDEIIVRVEIPLREGNWHFGFDEVARRHGDFAIAGIAGAVRFDGPSIAECRFVFAGVEPSPRRMHTAEQALIGAIVSDVAARDRTKAALLLDLEPMEGGEYPPAYRRHLAGILLGRVLDRIAASRTKR